MHHPPSATVLGRFHVYTFVLLRVLLTDILALVNLSSFIGVILSFWDMDPVQDIIKDIMTLNA